MEDLRKIKVRIDWICEHKINAFSPTISPAFKNKERNEIESILEAVKYYVGNGQYELLFQKKYMGSYCDIYLHKDIEASYLVSRNAHKITHIDMAAAIEALRPLHAKLDWTNVEMRIIQSELLPWRVLGKGLIEDDFGGYLQVHQSHLAYLQNAPLYDRIAAVRASGACQTYSFDKAQLSTKELAKKYATHIIRQYDAIESFLVLDFENYQRGIAVYKEQWEHFGKEQPMYFKPFNILKEVMDDGSEIIPNDNGTYAKVNEDEYLAITISPELDILEQVKPVYDWYNALASALEEGIMVKTKKAFLTGLAPAFKVRNNQYLTLIYGIDFMGKYAENFGKRNVKRKLECSINDWMQNWELLKTPFHKIDKENYAFKNVLLDRILGEQIENNLDHRL